jgi:Trp operon repressor
MTHISNKYLDEKELNKMFTQMNRTLSQLSKKEMDYFFSELLGKEERIMLAKRLSIIIMLMEKNSQYAIAEALHVSTSIVALQYRAYEAGRYNHIVGFFRKNKEKYEQLWKTLDTILRAGMPSQGRDRWKSVFPN